MFVLQKQQRPPRSHDNQRQMSAIAGIGAIVVPSTAGGFEITSLSAAGNARLHLQVGDRIMSIGSVATSGKTLAEVKNLILGPAGSTISMVCSALLLLDDDGAINPRFSSRRSSLVDLSTNQFLSAATPVLALHSVSLSCPRNATTAPRSRPLFPTALQPPQARIFCAEKTPYFLESHHVSDAASGLLQDDVILSFGASQLSNMPHSSAIAGATSSNIIQHCDPMCTTPFNPSHSSFQPSNPAMFTLPLLSSTALAPIFNCLWAAEGRKPRFHPKVKYQLLAEICHIFTTVSTSASVLSRWIFMNKCARSTANILVVMFCSSPIITKSRLVPEMNGCSLPRARVPNAVLPCGRYLEMI